ncbi:hypothetical protein GA830_13475 [Mesorhizobium sp. NBSH29]|uniref:YhdP family protein n=1 Tax=Mesorhizobium sp. NBSH29 TaxID=2654249 RepID=UPI0018968661|nr:AsmA-like C-terminal region-containing protein [Mesorhizobium sp. NBSH29]QPC87643.1 hypothetical protein GA830_13475 [Mesorhizobium sp. NBSH29]
MNQEVQKHEKIRFRQEEITSLTEFPSAEGQGHLLQRRGKLPWRILRAVAAVTSVVGGLLVITTGAVIFIGMTGIGSDRLRAEGEAAIERLVGGDVAAKIGSATLSLDASKFIALEVRDITVQSSDGKPMFDAGKMRFGVRFWPLMSGEVRLGSAAISEARITASSLPARDGPNWQAGLQRPDGLIDPDKVIDLLFGSLHRAFDIMEVGSTRRINLAGVDLELPEGGRMRSVVVSSAELLQKTNGQMSIKAEATIDGRLLLISGTAARTVTSRRISSVELRIGTPVPVPDKLEAAASLATPAGNRIDTIKATITGAEGLGDVPTGLSVRARIGGISVDLKDDGRITGDVDLSLAIDKGTAKAEIPGLVFTTGRSRFNFHGAVGPAPATDGQADAGSYRYELISDGSILAPTDSPEPALDILAKVSGNYDPLASRLTLDQIGVRTNGGELLGAGAFEFAPGKAPGITLALTVPDMAAGHVKQLWPWFAAPGARNWVLKNLFGGRLRDSKLHYRVPVGRIGNGIPVTHDEVFGTFHVENTRFDVTGRIPPVREADGIVAFRGNDIDIALSSGTVFMSSGRTVAATNGKLAIRDANRPPVIGALTIDVAGDAAAIAELASYEPINAMRHVGFGPDDLTSGAVTGHVRADIPLQNGIDPDRLDWLVSLNYRDLALSQPFDGQLVTGAVGTITVDPQKAVVAANANLNGVPSEIALVEPLRPAGPGRKRDITMTLNDKTREGLVPGLGDLVSGPVKVAFSAGPPASDGAFTPQKVTADLTDSKLSIPWAGWTKGAGVAAKVEFSLGKKGERVNLSKFKLSGKSFAIEGDIVLSGGSLSSANFSTIKLNRDDDIALDIKAAGKGYKVTVTGNSLDARAVVKQFTADADKATASVGKVPVSLDANVRRLVGFHGEQLTNVKLNYSGVGSTVLALDVAGATRSGGNVNVSNSTVDGTRTLKMRSADAGAILRFLDVYEHMERGTIALDLAGPVNGSLAGQVDARDFWVVNEPKLRSMVSTPPQGSDRSLNDAVKRDIDTSRVQFERGYAQLRKGTGSLDIENGVLRGPMIGTTFQGTLYNPAGRMAMTGTFMPAYGLNRLFGELPLVGMILGNGRDRGLIGVTYKLSGSAKSPNLEINPLSIIAPGIFRSIFEFH